MNLRDHHNCIKCGESYYIQGHRYIVDQLCWTCYTDYHNSDISRVVSPRELLGMEIYEKLFKMWVSGELDATTSQV
jgi:hypothetical protein